MSAGLQAGNACWTKTQLVIKAAGGKPSSVGIQWPIILVYLNMDQFTGRSPLPCLQCAQRSSCVIAAGIVVKMSDISSGNLWEELQEDSLRSDPQVTIIPQDHRDQSSCLQVTVSPVCWRKAESEDEKADSRWTPEQQNCLTGLHPVVCSGVESLAGYLSSCTTTISLM